MNNKQSSVEWLVEELWQTSKDRFIWSDLLEQAKAMHKEEIKQAQVVAFTDGCRIDQEDYESPFEDWEQYYKHTFEGGNK